MKSPLKKPFNDPVLAEQELKTKPESYWVKRGEKAALRLFHEMSERVPAYKKFLKEHKVRPSSIKTIEDFKKLPTINKDNYLRKYPLNELCWDGKFNEDWHVFASTSGSSGEPFYFPRSQEQDWQYAAVAEIYLRSQFDIHKKKTLYINGFAMGAWIGGLFTYQAVQYVAQRGKYPLHIITPGINRDENIRAIKKLAPNYEQIIIAGYPPFVKDLLDEGTEQNLDWSKYSTRIVFSAEGFSELFRDYIADKAGLENIYKDSVNHYGTVDLGTMSYETPLSIRIRRSALKDEELYDSIFKHSRRLPTLTQYIPELFYFEEDEGRLYCSARSGIPLVRYDLKDFGGVISFEEATEQLQEAEGPLDKLYKRDKIQNTILNLPFVYVYERADFSVVLYGANIYPENIRKALHSKGCAEHLTGKFTMRIIENKQKEPRLELNVELKRGQKGTATLRRVVLEKVFSVLLAENSEFRSNFEQLPKKMKPTVKFWDFNDPTHFSGKGKQKWVLK